jgi:hypothetical protein
MPMPNSKPPPMPRHIADDPDHWRQRGEEMRAIAEGNLRASATYLLLLPVRSSACAASLS